MRFRLADLILFGRLELNLRIAQVSIKKALSADDPDERKVALSRALGNIERILDEKGGPVWGEKSLRERGA